MHVGILGGTGPAGRGLAARLAVAGMDVTIGSREAARGAGVAEELVARWPERRLSVRGGDNEAAAAGETVVVATPWEGVGATLRPLRDALGGKVVVSVAVALQREGREMHALVGPRGSVAAGVAADLPDSMVAAALHHLPASSLEDLDLPLEADVLVCSDHAAATARASELVDAIAGLRAIDAGSLAQAGPIEALTAVLITVNIRHKVHSTLRLGGI